MSEGSVLTPRDDRAVPCCKCGAHPTIKSRQFRGPPWSGRTGWRVFCGTGWHNAGTSYRAHRADAIAEWNTLQEFASKTGRDPGKLGTRSDALLARASTPVGEATTTQQGGDQT